MARPHGLTRHGGGSSLSVGFSSDSFTIGTWSITLDHSAYAPVSFGESVELFASEVSKVFSVAAHSNSDAATRVAYGTSFLTPYNAVSPLGLWPPSALGFTVMFLCLEVFGGR